MHWLPNSRWAIVGICCLATGCAVFKGRPTKDYVEVAATTSPPGPPTAEPVRAIEVDRGTESGQTMWQIQPAVSLVPSINADAGRLGSIPPHIASRLQYAFDLAQRGAVYSAYSEFEQVLRLCAADVDAAWGGRTRRTAVEEGLVALEEVEHFTAPNSQCRSVSIDVGRISAAHRTPFHQQIVAQGWNAEIATRAYYEYAMERLAAGCFDSAAAPNAIYGLARTAALLKDRASHGPLRAMHLYDLTLRLDPSHALAANELGVMLSHNGRFHEAEHVLLHAVNCGDCPESWENLATVYSRLGKQEESEWAMQQARAEEPDAATPQVRLASKPLH